MYILPLFSYVAQLARGNKEISTFLCWLKDRLFSGPGNWLHIGTLTDFKRIGFPVELRDLANTMLASKIRVAANSVLDIESLHVLVGRHILCHKAIHGHSHWLAEWHGNILINNIVMAKRGYDIDTANEGFVRLGRRKQPGGDKVKQKLIFKRLRESGDALRATAFQQKMRRRLDRWKTELPPAHVAGRAVRRLHALKG